MLKLIDAEKARLYGLPAHDLKEEDALKILAPRFGENARYHLTMAIASGAFESDKSVSNETEKE